WVSRPGLFHQPPLVAAVVVLIRAGVHVAQLRALGRVPVAAYLDIQLLQSRPIVRFEEVVEYLRSLGLDVVHEQRGRSAAATHRADSRIGAPGASAIDGDGLGKGTATHAEDPHDRGGEEDEANTCRSSTHGQYPSACYLNL